MKSVATLNSESKRTFLPTELYLPEWARDTEFFQDIAIIINYLENSLADLTNEKYAMVEQAYRDIVFKYKDLFELSEETLKSILIENGFSALMDMLELDKEKLQMIMLYLPLFKILRGTDIGYRQLLKLLSYDFEIETWLDNPVELDEYTYNLTFITFLNTGFGRTITSDFIKFSRSYVYPVLKKIVIKVIYRSLSPAVYGRPKIEEIIRIKCFETPYERQRTKVPVYGRIKVDKRLKVR